ncbi:restriction endonuclease subunit S [Vibrio sp. ZF57]|uniref:restriction endonuclease subunit S n=1 Tax=Vibrio sp. ZF57 TaxID=1840084 RepID=UPI00080E1BF4|nr:restriction endonuclease subunit S [Vibrio sp. ZF57]OCH56318.1 hypothetical protein A6D97_19025 [Vibrio sp. ZF57]
MRDDNKVIVKFGDVAKQLKESVDRDSNPFERYIEGGHLDSDSLRIKRWGVFNGDYVGPAFHRVFRKGNILYGSRRTYLKKVATAEFEGITANTTFVIEAKSNDDFDGRLLPFLMLTDSFTRYSVSKSKGSTNPYINWKDLVNFEFVLPSKKEQIKVYRILHKTEQILLDTEKAKNHLVSLKRSVERDLLLGGNDFHSLFGTSETIIPQGWKLVKLGEILTRVQYGSSDALHQDGVTPVLRMMNLENGKVTDTDLKYSKLSSSGLKDIILKKGDILFNRTNSMEWVGRTALFNLDGDFAFASYLLRLNFDSNVTTPEFINRVLNHPLVQYRLKAYATPGVSQANINPNSLKQLPVVLPPLCDMEKTEKQLKDYDAAIHELELKIESVKRIQEYFRESLLED